MGFNNVFHVVHHPSDFENVDAVSDRHPTIVGSDIGRISDGFRYPTLVGIR